MSLNARIAEAPVAVATESAKPLESAQGMTLGILVLGRDVRWSVHGQEASQGDAMTATTLIKRLQEMPREPLPRCHEGSGVLDWIRVLDGADTDGRGLNFIHDDILPPGASIGVHRHEDDEEYYYVLAGRGVMTLDGTEFEVAAGDITAVYPGGEHGLDNRADEALRIVVISVKAGAPS
jgi:uncharacterized RmlC-like cupin family protein